MHDGAGALQPSQSLQYLREFHGRLLLPTLENAGRTSFYRERWGDRRLASVTLDTLDELPLIRKADLVEAGVAAQLRGEQVCDEILSSGTTGAPFVTIRGQREQQRIAELFSALNSGGPTTPVARGLAIQNPQHGFQVRVPAAIRLHPVSIYDKHSFTHGVRVLRSTFNEPGVASECSLIVAGERCLRAFVQYLEAHAITVEDGPPRYAVTFGHYVPQHLRHRVRRVLNAEIIDRFSISEAFGGATESLRDGWYYFDPLLIPEVVSLDDGRRITDGIGELVLTALYPFQECQPLVRYATGDLVRVTHTGAAFPGQLGIKPLGRHSAAVWSSEPPGLLFAATDLYEAIDPLDWPSREAVFRDAREVSDAHGLGNPLYAVQTEADGSRELIHIQVQAPSSRDRQLDAARELDVRERLLGRSPVASELVARGCKVVTVSLVDHVAAPWPV